MSLYAGYFAQGFNLDPWGLEDTFVILPTKATKDKAEQAIIKYWYLKKKECGKEDTITLIHAQRIADARGKIFDESNKYDTIVITGHGSNEKGGGISIGGDDLGPKEDAFKFKSFMEVISTIVKENETRIRYEGCLCGYGERGESLLEKTVKITKVKSAEAYTGYTNRGKNQDTFENNGDLLRHEKGKTSKVEKEERQKVNK